jgi:hypothetical protein
LRGSTPIHDTEKANENKSSIINPQIVDGEKRRIDSKYLPDFFSSIVGGKNQMHRNISAKYNCIYATESVILELLK